MSTSSPAGWQPDPRGRHEYRYWDGSQWTDHVSNQGQTSTDPVSDVSETPTSATAAPPPGPAGGTPVTEPAAGTPVTEQPAATASTPYPGAVGPEATEAQPSYTPAASTPPEPVGGTTAPPPGTRGTGTTPGGSTPDARATAQQVMHSKSPEVGTLLSIVAPGSGHFYMGSNKIPIAAGLLVATVVAAVLSYFSFVLFLVGFAIWAAAAVFAVTDLRGSLKGLQNTSMPKNVVGLLCIVGGALLVLSLLLPWYHVTIDAGGASLSENGSGFEVLGIIDIVLLVIGVAAIVAGAVALGVGPVSSGDLPKALPMAIAVGGAVATLLVLFRMFVDVVDIPGGFGGDIAVGRAPGILLAFGASLTLLIANLSVLRSAANK